jgi:MYXO-CTERM domain-containing protein
MFKTGSRALVAFAACLLAAGSAICDIKVGLVGGGGASHGDAAGQLNNDTFFDFTASVLTAGQADTLAELQAYDVVVLGSSGFGDDNGYTDQMMAAMRQYLDAGGGIVTVGWWNYATDFMVGQKALDADYISPIADGTYDFEQNPGTIDIFNIAHPITAGISDFNFTANFTEYESAVDGNATALAATAAGANRYTIVYQDALAGRSVYLGGLYFANAGSYNTGGLRSGVEDQLFEQAVAWAGTIPAPGALALLGLAGIASRSRRRD